MGQRRFTYIDHAREQMTRRTIDPAWVERTVLAPETTEPDPQHPDRVRAFRSVPERDGRVLRVVYVPEGDDYRVLTTFLDRSLRAPTRGRGPENAHRRLIAPGFKIAGSALKKFARAL